MAINSALGQDLHLGNRCSKRAFTWARQTFGVRAGRAGAVMLDENASFSNIVRFGSARIGITSDGIGTKIELAERCGVYDTLGFDLIAMVADDLIASGIEPTGLSNILDVDCLNENTVEELMHGLHNAALAARMTVTGGEIAELGSRIGGYGTGMHFNWCATAFGQLPEGRDPLTGVSVKDGDKILAIYSPGLRSNGFSLARGILQKNFGDDWHRQIAEGDAAGKAWGELLLTPSLIYAPVLHDLLNVGLEIHGLAHVTGGGLPDNLGRVLRVTGTGAILDDLFVPENFLLSLQKMGEISDSHLYHSWNMNHGMLVILPPDTVDQAAAHIESAGFTTRLIGHIKAETGITIFSRGLHSETLFYDGKGK